MLVDVNVMMHLAHAGVLAHELCPPLDGGVVGEVVAAAAAAAAAVTQVELSDESVTLDVVIVAKFLLPSLLLFLITATSHQPSDVDGGALLVAAGGESGQAPHAEPDAAAH